MRSQLHNVAPERRVVMIGPFDTANPDSNDRVERVVPTDGIDESLTKLSSSSTQPPTMRALAPSF